MSARSYLDHASTSPLRPAARQALVAALDLVGDPGRIHAEGLTARVTVEQARQHVADLLGARPREVVFTSGATEAIAAACWGAARKAGAGTAQVVPAVEHSAVRQAAAQHGAVVSVPVDGRGRVAAGDVLAAVGDDTAVVHLQWGNHEVGTLQPVAEVVSACRERGVLVHVDAAQAAGHVPIAFRDLGADLLSVSAHKFGGPRGVGALLVRQGLRLPPLLVGSDQERARRAGLENVPAIAGFGAACAALAGAGHTGRGDAAPAGAGHTGRGDVAPAGAVHTRTTTGEPARAVRTRTTTDETPRTGHTPTTTDETAAAGYTQDPGPSPAGIARAEGTGTDVSGVEAEGAVQRRHTDRVLAAVADDPALAGLSVYGDPDHRLPHIVCLGVEGIEPQAVLLGLDRAGIAAHSGSACSSESLEPSPVLEAMGVDAHHSLRLSVGWSTTDADVDHLLDVLPRVLADLRALAASVRG